MAEIVYMLCGLFSFICAWLLFRSYRKAPSHLLFWSGLSFGLMALNNIILFVDLVIFPQVEFSGALIRTICSALAGIVLLFGLIWELS
jgi:hypothetical protein